MLVKFLSSFEVSEETFNIAMVRDLKTNINNNWVYIVGTAEDWVLQYFIEIKESQLVSIYLFIYSFIYFIHFF